MVQNIETIRSGFAARLREAAADAGLKEWGLGKRLADAAGVTPKASSKWLNLESMPDRIQMLKLADFLKVRAEWLEHGVEPKHSGFMTPETTYEAVRLLARQEDAVLVGDLSPWDDSTPLDDDEVELPLYKEVELAAGCGRTAVQEIPGRKLRFSYATLRAAGVDPAAAVCAQLKGNSMEPLIMNGATIGIDKATTRIVDGEIYALEHEGMLRVKYLYRLPGGGLRLRSFNRDEYPDEEYSPEEMQAKSISIIGWVFWWSTLRTRGAFKR